jgi:hypothetical protein
MNCSGLLAAFSLLALVGCSKGEPASGGASAGAPVPVPSGDTISTAASGDKGASASASAAASAAKPVDEPAAAWKGTFKSRPGVVTLAKEAAEAVKVWAKDPGVEMVGDGEITLRIPGSKGLVQGEISGILGDLLVNGELEEDQLHARVDAKDPNDQKAMTGVLHLKRKGEAWEGMLRVASRNANLVREADLRLSR